MASLATSSLKGTSVVQCHTASRGTARGVFFCPSQVSRAVEVVWPQCIRYYQRRVPAAPCGQRGVTPVPIPWRGIMVRATSSGWRGVGQDPWRVHPVPRPAFGRVAWGQTRRASFERVRRGEPCTYPSGEAESTPLGLRVGLAGPRRLGVERDGAHSSSIRWSERGLKTAPRGLRRAIISFGSYFSSSPGLVDWLDCFYPGTLVLVPDSSPQALRVILIGSPGGLLRVGAGRVCARRGLSEPPSLQMSRGSSPRKLVCLSFPSCVSLFGARWWNRISVFPIGPPLGPTSRSAYLPGLGHGSRSSRPGPS